MKILPKKIFFVKGKGVHEDALISFELALRDAGIEKFNFVPVSSIIPPECKVVEAKDGLKELEAGEIVFCVMARKTSSEQGKTIYASIGAAFPKGNFHGYLTEYCGFLNTNDFDPGKYAEASAIKMFKMVHGIRPEKTFHITSFSKVEKFTTVVAVAVFII